MKYELYEDVASVKLAAYTTPVMSLQNVDVKTAQDLIAYCARVSNPAGQLSEERDDEKLIKYLINHKHWSPLEMSNAVLEINTTRDIGRQILRHKTASFQEFSQRYAKVVTGDTNSGLQFVLKEARLQDTKNRQNSIELNKEQSFLSACWYTHQIDVIDKAKETYEWALSKGVAKEQARCVLPEGNTMTRFFMNATLRTWVHFIELRTGNGTQKENRLIARACAKAISSIFPMVNNFVQK